MALDGLIAGGDVPLAMAAGGGVYDTGPFRSRNWERAALSEYQTNYRPWVESVFKEAYGLGAISPSASELVQGRNVSQLRTLSSVLREAGEELRR